MNTKTKLMLGLSALTAGTLAAGATGTFAWFTTNKTAIANYTKITARADTRKLKIDMAGLTDTNLGEQSNYTAATSTEAEKWADEVKLNSTASYVSDISSKDGMNFVKPVWVNGAANDAYVEKDLKSVAVKDNMFTQYYVKLTNTGSAAMNVFLNQTTAITATDSSKDADVALAKWTRVAIISYGENKPTAGSTTGTLAWLFENNIGETVEKGKYVSRTEEDATSEETVKPYKLTLSDVDANTHVVGAFGTVTSTTATTQKGFLATVDANKSVYYMISVWMEGTENDTQDKADTGSIDVKLGFSGIDA